MELRVVSQFTRSCEKYLRHSLSCGANDFLSMILFIQFSAIGGVGRFGVFWGFGCLGYFGGFGCLEVLGCLGVWRFWVFWGFGVFGGYG